MFLFRLLSQVDAWSAANTLVEVIAAWALAWPREPVVLRDDDALRCPLTLQVMHSPVSFETEPRRSYERRALERWLEVNPVRDPMTGCDHDEALSFVANVPLRVMIQESKLLLSDDGSPGAGWTTPPRRRSFFFWGPGRPRDSPSPGLTKKKKGPVFLPELLVHRRRRRRTDKKNPERKRVDCYIGGRCVYRYESSSDEDDDDSINDD